ncbi:helix-hairpin-helix domain-containing protein [Clostridium sp.]|uniref:helix-hairpin-helix domain-containing protein n=1 Tax=Clostridium sp. TaxID=1506 RepID=UPI003F35FD31
MGLFGDNYENEKNEEIQVDINSLVGEEFTFRLDKTMFNKDNFTIARIFPTSRNVHCIMNRAFGNFSIKGNMPSLLPNIEYKCEIIKVEENKFGHTCDVVGVTPKHMSMDNLKSDEDMISFIDIFVGEGTANKCANVSGLCDMIKKKDIGGLTSIKGIGVSTANKIISAFEDNIENGTYITKLRKMGFTQHEIKKMADGCLGSLSIALDVVKSNPYSTTYRFGLRLDRVDNIAITSLGIDRKDKRRVEAYVYKSLHDELDETNSSYITLDRLYNNDIMFNLTSNVGVDIVKDCIDTLYKDERVEIIDNHIIGMKYDFYAEEGSVTVV